MNTKQFPPWIPMVGLAASEHLLHAAMKMAECDAIIFAVSVFLSRPANSVLYK